MCLVLEGSRLLSVFLRLSYCPHAAASPLYETNVMKFTFTRPGRAFNMKGQIEEILGIPFCYLLL